MTVRAGWIGAMVAVLLLASGCAPEPGPSPSASVSESPTPSSTPEDTATPTPTPTPSATPAPTGPPATRPVESPTPDAGGMTDAQAGALCAEEHRGGQSAGDTQIGDPTVYERTVSPRWYVTILAENEFGQYYQECILGGTLAAPEWSLTQGTPAADVTDEYIEHQRTHNEGFDEDHDH
ncbi:hypothetical protein KZX37_09155 [Microbacterium sp. EYE_5]|uniref:hypothetical protein n=1 Tax=unclassified Microbacterium TaxID=2609290 RepID=UPI0020049543|nr:MULTISPECIES: hypothetical protein [unclassified Microbacterium]MCK6081317.1 hypothetical protein [Microbacterium sp. EYE_382]MCK6086587.1 hypothetical protein [Microbacterium sp. EYE_384]MCK6123915.1 hypothetical protein [Microbacterium sp. EYE_80]MCK6126824.1 hypothetical protein [Microbacterium sp. EYE_79]MCK6142272.1 hypothetical protein [Microbacterium sp. EYE_39]